MLYISVFNIIVIFDTTTDRVRGEKPATVNAMETTALSKIQEADVELPEIFTAEWPRWTWLENSWDD